MVSFAELLVAKVTGQNTRISPKYQVVLTKINEGPGRTGECVANRVVWVSKPTGRETYRTEHKHVRCQHKNWSQARKHFEMSSFNASGSITSGPGLAVQSSGQELRVRTQTCEVPTTCARGISAVWYRIYLHEKSRTGDTYCRQKILSPPGLEPESLG